MNVDKERVPSLIDIEVLDLGPLYEQAVAHYVAQDPQRAQWDRERLSRLRIRTECRWGRLVLEDNSMYVLNEKGEGPREPLSDRVCAFVSLYAEMKAAGEDPGYFEAKPFCKVAVDRGGAASFRSVGIVALEDFIRQKIPEMEEAYEAWLGLLRTSVQKAKAARARARQPVG